MCNCSKPCCYPKPCCPRNPCAPTSKVNTSDITYNGSDLECSGIIAGSGLNQLFTDLDAFICANTSEQEVEIINIGAGAGNVYAGDNGSGQKQLRTITGDDSVDITTVGNTVQVAVNPEWVQENAGDIIFPENIVEFDTADPNSGSPTFTPNTPQDPDALYFSNVNNTNWIWNGTVYVTAPPSPNATPFNLAGTTTDAGGNKVANISRKGWMGVNVGTPSEALHVDGNIRQTGVTSSLIKASATGVLVPAVAGTDYLTPTGSAALLTGFPTFNQNTTGNAATVTTIPTLSGDVTNIGNAVTLSNTGVVSGTYTNPIVTVTAQGRISSISNGGAGRGLADFTTTVQNATNTLTTLYTYTMPANTLANDGDKLDIMYAGKFDNSPTLKTLIISIGSNTFAFSITDDGNWRIKLELIRISPSTYAVSAFWSLGKIGFDTYSDTNLVVTGFNASQAIALQGQGTNTGDITATSGWINYIPKAS